MCMRSGESGNESLTSVWKYICNLCTTRPKHECISYVCKGVFAGNFNDVAQSTELDEESVWEEQRHSYIQPCVDSNHQHLSNEQLRQRIIDETSMCCPIETSTSSLQPRGGVLRCRGYCGHRHSQPLIRNRGRISEYVEIRCG